MACVNAHTKVYTHTVYMQWITENKEEIANMLMEFALRNMKDSSIGGARKGLPSVEDFSYRGKLYHEQSVS